MPHVTSSALDRSSTHISDDAARRTLEALAAPYANARPREDRWAPVPFELDERVAEDLHLAEAALRARLRLTHDVTRRIGSVLPRPLVPRYIDALLRSPRERFVLPEDIAYSATDAPLPLDREGMATVSAPHAYLLTYGLLELDEGDHLLELGTGTGYGAAIARHIVGPTGRIASVEIDPALAARARHLLYLLERGGPPCITLFEGDGTEVAPALLRSLTAPRPIKVAVTFAMNAVPSALVDLLPEGSCLVAPVAWSEEGEPPPNDQQELLRWEKQRGRVERTTHGAVRYVSERHTADIHHA
jgi:protein-L-isoaspartate(D-aspartate) O-methyltransferase